MGLNEKTATIIQARDDHWDQKREEMGAAFDEEEVMVKYARHTLLQTNNTSDMMLTAELLIDEDWLGQVDALPGNVYRLAVMGDVFVNMGEQGWHDRAQSIAKIIGILLIIAIQIVGPPMIFFSRLQGVGVLAEVGYKWECCPWHPRYESAADGECYYQGTAPKDVFWHDDWHHVATTKCLGMLMMAAFILNGLFVVLAERSSWKQIYNTFRYLDIMNPRFKLEGTSFLYMDALVNTWVIGWCCIDVFLVVGDSKSPSDVLMNALGLVFLYNLDDVGGDLGFINENDWPGLRLSWIYKKIVEPCPKEIFDENMLDTPGRLVTGLYSLTVFGLVVLTVTVPVIAAFTPFIQIVPS